MIMKHTAHADCVGMELKRKQSVYVVRILFINHITEYLNECSLKGLECAFISILREAHWRSINFNSKVNWRIKRC